MPNRQDELNYENTSEQIKVTEWEASFMESNVDLTEFSNGQRKVIDSMIDRYKHRI